MGDADDGSTSELASALLVRVSVEHDDWFNSLDAESGDLSAIGEALLDRTRLAEIDEESLFASSLLIVDLVSVRPEHRGSRLSHAFIRAVAEVFRGDIVALMPAGLSSTSSGGLVLDEEKRQGLRRHWADGGFIGIPGTDVMILSRSDR